MVNLEDNLLNRAQRFNGKVHLNLERFSNEDYVSLKTCKNLPEITDKVKLKINHKDSRDQEF